MPTIAEVRQQFPQYQDMPDAALADALHRKFYADMPRADFDAKIGLTATPMQAPVEAAPVVPAQDPNIVRGGLLPLSKNRQTGEVSFDSNAGIVGAIKSALSLPGEVAAGKFETKPETPGVLSDVDQARAQANEATLGKRTMELATMASPISAGSRVAASAAAAGVKAPKPALPEIEALKESARAAYKVADDAGIVVSEKSFGPLVKDIASTVVKEGLDPTLHPGATAALKRLGEVQRQPVALSTIDTLRQVVKDAAASKTPGEARLASMMIDKIDDYVKGIGMKDVVAAAENPAIATKALTDARGLWASARKSEAVENLVERATTRAGQFSGSGFENALRTEFRQFVMNKKNLRGYSKEEVAALKKVAEGGTIDNLARYVGKLAPTGVVSGVLSGGAGAAIGGGIGAVALPVAGFAARQYATRRTQGNVEKVRELVRGVEREPSGRATANKEELLRSILARSRVFGGSQLLTTTPNR
jgi:hypothetical protein